MKVGDRLEVVMPINDAIGLKGWVYINRVNEKTGEFEFVGDGAPVYVSLKDCPEK